MRRSYKFLLRPTARQRAALDACLEDTRQLYNATSLDVEGLKAAGASDLAEVVGVGD